MNSDYNNSNYEIDPNFAEKLMSTFYAGGDMSETDYKKCQKIWADHNNNRSEVLKIVVELCGNVDTPQARYIRAIAWSFNSVIYSSERINAINDYLGKKLYFKAYKNNSQTIDRGLKYGTKAHIARMLRYMADAYSHLKMYEKEEETYLKIYNLGIIIPNGCVSLAKYYSKRNQKERAILILEKEKRTLKYILNKEYREPILRYLDELKKSQKGIRKHFFSGYDSWPGPFLGPIDNPVYHPELEEKYNNLKGRYKSTFENHRDFLEKIDFYEARIKENVDDIESKENFNTYCLSDINLLPKIFNYYKELNKLGFNTNFEYEDNRNSNYPIFKKLISFYEKEKKYDEAVKLCDIAINYGITNYFGKTSMNDKKEKLKRQIQ